MDVVSRMVSWRVRGNVEEETRRQGKRPQIDVPRETKRYGKMISGWLTITGYNVNISCSQKTDGTWRELVKVLHAEKNSQPRAKRVVCKIRKRCSTYHGAVWVDVFAGTAPLTTFTSKPSRLTPLLRAARWS